MFLIILFQCNVSHYNYMFLFFSSPFSLLSLILIYIYNYFRDWKSAVYYLFRKMWSSRDLVSLATLNIFAHTNSLCADTHTWTQCHTGPHTVTLTQCHSQWEQSVSKGPTPWGSTRPLAKFDRKHPLSGHRLFPWHCWDLEFNQAPRRR